MITTILGYITWKVKPQIFFLGPMEIRWYGLLYAMGFYFGYLIIKKIFEKEKVNMQWLDSLFVYVIVGTILGARLGHVFFYGWEYYSRHLLEIFQIWKGGLASHGGAIGIFLSVLLFSRRVSKRNVFWTIDRLVIPVSLAAVMIRTGNLMNHEIYGLPTHLPWAFRFVTNIHAWQHGAAPVYSLPSHPTQIYEALCYLFTFIIMITTYTKYKEAKYRNGLLTGIFFIIVFGSRFFIEFIKENQEAFEATMTLNMGQLLSIPFVIIGIILVIHALKAKPVYYGNEKVKQRKTIKKNFNENVKAK